MSKYKTNRKITIPLSVSYTVEIDDEGQANEAEITRGVIAGLKQLVTNVINECLQSDETQLQLNRLLDTRVCDMGGLSGGFSCYETFTQFDISVKGTVPYWFEKERNI